MHNRTLLLTFFFLLASMGELTCKAAPQNAPPDSPSVQQLEQRVDEIDGELATLAQYNLRSGVGAIGYRSQAHVESESSRVEWIQINFDDVYEIDELVLVPTFLRDADTGFKDDAFPKELRVFAGVDATTNGTDDPASESLVASFDESDQLSPRVAPVIVNCKGIKASWIRVEATHLSSRQFDGRYVFQLSEILAFSGSENVAIARPVETSSNVPSGSPAWDKRFAVDGFVPYLMNSSTEEASLAFASRVGIGDKPSLTIDLEQESQLSEVRIHLVGQGDTVPQSYGGDFGFPGQLLIEGATKSDFSDAKVLLDYRHKDFYDIGPILARRVPKTTCRYVRMMAIDPYEYSFEDNVGTRLGFAELELLSGGENVALGKEVSADFASSDRNRRLQAITDGKNRYGQILSTREWMNQLARRHDLEAERPRVSQELNKRYQQQKAILNWLVGLAGLLALGGVIAVFVGWNMRERAVRRTRERIAADLHDELGANFHAIGLLSDLVQKSSDSPEKLKPLLGRIRELTERTGTATSHCVNMLESVGLYEELEQDMRRASQRITADLENRFVFEGKQHLEQLGPRKRIDLFLFYKESLTNIIRHSEATRVTTHLHATHQELYLRVTDNGQGIQESFTNGVPPSLYRRAKLLGAEVKRIPVEIGGTELELKLKLGRRWPMSMFGSSTSKRKQTRS